MFKPLSYNWNEQRAAVPYARSSRTLTVPNDMLKLTDSNRQLALNSRQFTRFRAITA